MRAGNSGPGRGVTPVVLALGSNLGDRLAHLQSGVDTLCAEPGLDCAAVSPVYETAAVGGPAQPDYLNAVLIAATTLPARAREQRWGPRTLDVDVIVYGDEISGDPELTLPHPRAHERAFVLAPWHDVDPHAVLPGRGPVADLLAAADTAGVRRRNDTRLERPQ
jgi:2-amino-4-hydroxy-6-hydroxymethyldihydropteridine diphosphokinase